jgi:hypothetical protein
MTNPNERLDYYVTGAIERGEAAAIVAQPAPQSFIQHGVGGTSFVGPDAVNLVRAVAIKSALRLAAVGLRASRTVTPTKLLVSAGQITGKTYKRGQYGVAILDLEAKLAEMRAAIPVKL